MSFNISSHNRCTFSTKSYIIPSEDVYSFFHFETQEYTGPKRVGFISGPAPGEDVDEDDSSDNANLLQRQKAMDDDDSSNSLTQKSRLHRRDTPHHLKNKRVHTSLMDKDKVETLLAQVNIFPVLSPRIFKTSIKYLILKIFLLWSGFFITYNELNLYLDRAGFF